MLREVRKSAFSLSNVAWKTTFLKSTTIYAFMRQAYSSALNAHADQHFVNRFHLFNYSVCGGNLPSDRQGGVSQETAAVAKNATFRRYGQ